VAERQDVLIDIKVFDNIHTKVGVESTDTVLLASDTPLNVVKLLLAFLIASDIKGVGAVLSTSIVGCVRVVVVLPASSVATACSA
jgi:hypothetical protein